MIPARKIFLEELPNGFGRHRPPLTVEDYVFALGAEITRRAPQTAREARSTLAAEEAWTGTERLLRRPRGLARQAGDPDRPDHGWAGTVSSEREQKSPQSIISRPEATEAR